MGAAEGELLLKILAGVGALIVVVVGIVVYFEVSAAVASERARTDSNVLLESVRTRANTGADLLQATPAIDTSGANPDFAKAKRTTDEYASRIAQVRTTTEADHVKLLVDRDHLRSQATGLPALPFRPALDSQRLRVESMLSALEAEDKGLQVVQDLMVTTSSVFDASAALVVVLDRLDAQDFSDALAAFPDLDAKLQNAARLASGPSNPPQLQKFVANLQTLSTDLKALVQAVQRQDIGAVQAQQQRLDADGAALEGFDEQGFDSYERTVLQPYVDRFDSGVRAAGFTPTN